MVQNQRYGASTWKCRSKWISNSQSWVKFLWGACPPRDFDSTLAVWSPFRPPFSGTGSISFILNHIFYYEMRNMCFCSRNFCHFVCPVDWPISHNNSANFWGNHENLLINLGFRYVLRFCQKIGGILRHFQIYHKN